MTAVKLIIESIGAAVVMLVVSMALGFVEAWVESKAP